MLEGINFRQNNFSDQIIESIAEGIKMKKELRVIILLSHSFRQLILVKIRFQM